MLQATAEFHGCAGGVLNLIYAVSGLRPMSAQFQFSSSRVGSKRRPRRPGRYVFSCLAGISLLCKCGPANAEPPNLSHYQLVFNEDFKNFSVSAHGPNTRWTAHTPWNGDFGDAEFADPRPGFPFTVSDGVLQIELRKGSNGRWQSGLLASVDSEGKGFSLQYGYFEMRAKLPAGPGIWPAFWLDSMIPKTSTDPSLEIDVLEHYGKFPYTYNSTVTLWPKIEREKRQSQMKINQVESGSLSRSFHSYGVDVKSDWIVFYFDSVETWRVKTPEQHKHALMILVDLGLGSGWPIDETPNPAFMEVAYIRAYAPIINPR